ncbi:heme-binding protein 2-like [Oncorhynchus mykiss]|uniref:heme-binding protein 2-like n=1 Tax=Oncorhynchus mykiss TaxID=8022 RepID=UPI00187836F2|nr:heme-binding protein 2-like [Oncorhynchus mykiss]
MTGSLAPPSAREEEQEQVVYLAGSVGLLLTLTADARVGNSSESSFCTERKECLLCDQVCKNDDYEVRHYDSVKWVSTDKEAHFMDKAIVTTFMRLFKYITRSNRAGINIDMTVPVIVEEMKRISRSFVYTLSFVMPSAHHMTPPQPTDDKVRPNRPLHPMPYALVEI